MRIVTVPVLSDNYSYIIIDDKTSEVAVVDPVEPKKVLKELESLNLTSHLKSVITTHHHADHSGGNRELNKLHPGLKFIGGDERIPALNAVVKDGDAFEIGSIKFKAIKTIGHTTGSITFYLEDESNNQRVVFTGDTLFIGKLFEGTPDQMYDSLINRIGALPGDTKVYPGHEYTRKNLEFALTVDGENPDLKAKVERIKNLSITVPSTIKEEWATNPFLRVREPALIASTGKTDPIDVLGAIRKLKDAF
ncbi:Cytoplasmic glyoxalase II [Mycoemilia scoparia]|uniref:hydroxyacylglutathione hydrolase n=1 Tax=Mycoemilia scoparia TaxID=417184 RepID=A0A9W8A1A9_9FUNG|nr:Cytoplasmic glyoxalase II [Mycoemilia scoparia]